jgi:hypothetical protein
MLKKDFNFFPNDLMLRFSSNAISLEYFFVLVQVLQDIDHLVFLLGFSFHSGHHSRSALSRDAS